MQKPSPHSKSILSANCATHIVQDGLTSTIFVLLPVLAQAFGLTYAQVGLLKGMSNAAQAVLEFGSGWLTERLGEVRLIIVGVVLAAGGYLGLSMAPNILLITTCLMVIGAGTALHHAPSSSLIANGFPLDKRSSALGIYNASGDVGKLVFTGGFSLATGLGLAWFQISLIFALVGLIGALVIAYIARSFGRETTSIPVDAQQYHNSKAVKGWGILNGRSFGALLTVTGIDTVVQTGIFVFVAFLMLSKGLPLWIATAATVILLAGGVFGKAGCGYLTDRMGTHRAFILIQILTALGLIGIIIAPNWLALVLLFPLGSVAQGSSSITYGFAANLIHPQKMARGYALLYSSGTLAAAIGPLVFGWIADGWGIETAILSMAFIVLLSVPPMLILPAHSKVAVI